MIIIIQKTYIFNEKQTHSIRMISSGRWKSATTLIKMINSFPTFHSIPFDLFKVKALIIIAPHTIYI